MKIKVIATFTKNLLSPLITAISLLFLGSNHTSAQQTISAFSKKQYQIQQFTDEQGLPQNSVKKISSDRSGFIWLGTDAGLTRFDGQRFLHFDQFTSIRGIHSFEPDRANPSIGFYGITDQYDRIRIKRGSAQLVRTNQEKRKKYQLNSYLPYPDSLMTRGLPEPTHGSVFPHHLIIPYPPHKKIVCSDSSITFFEKETQRRKLPPLGPDKYRYFRLDNTLYYLEKDGSFKYVDFGIAEPTVVSQLVPTIPTQDSSEFILFWSNNNNQTLIASGSRLFLLRKYTNGKIVSEQILSDFNFKEKKIISIYYDERRQKLFLGSATEGLFMISPKYFRSLTGIPTSNINHNVFYGQTLLNNQSILTAQAEQFAWNNKGSIKNTVAPLLKNHFNGDKYSIIKDSEGNIWTKNFDYLYKYDQDGQRVVSKMRFKEGMTWLYEGRNKKLWIGFRFAGLYQMDLNSKNLVPQKFIGAPFENISWMHQSTDSTLWVGTDHGLFEVNLSTKETTIIKQLKGLFIRSIYSPHADEMWVTTYKNGFYLIKGGRIIKFPLDQKRHLARAHCMVEDSTGYMWVTTNNGLFKIKKASLLGYAPEKPTPYYQHFDKTNGFTLNEFNGGCQPCGLQLPNGYLSFPSMEGLVWFKPSDIATYPTSTAIHVDNIYIDNQEVVLHNDSLTIDHDFNRLRLNLSKPYFDPLDNLQLYYALTPKGSKVKQWYKLEDKDFKITISLLQPGEYLLTVRAVDGFEIGNQVEKYIRIIVAKPWYQSWWAYTAGLILLATLLYTLLTLRLRKALQRNEILEEKVRERTITLRETILNMKVSQKQLINQNQLHGHIIASISHDIRSPLKFIYNWLDSVPKNMESNDTSSMITSSMIIKKSVANMMHLTDDMTNYLKARTSGVHEGLGSISIKELVDKKTELFKNLSWFNKGTIHNQIDSDLRVFTNENLLGIVIHNLLDNALKANPSGQVHILMERTLPATSGKLQLIVVDNGPGLSEELKEWLNAPVENNALPPKNYHGLGLTLIKNICDMLHIRLRVNVTKGTKFEFSFPDPSEFDYQIISTNNKT